MYVCVCVCMCVFNINVLRNIIILQSGFFEKEIILQGNLPIVYFWLL